MLKRVVHPGEILKDELDEMGVAPTTFARQIDVPPNRVGQIIAGKRSVTGDTVKPCGSGTGVLAKTTSSLRFGHWFGVDPRFWLNLQSAVRPRSRRPAGWTGRARIANRRRL